MDSHCRWYNIQHAILEDDYIARGITYNMLSLKTTISHVIRRFRITADISILVLRQVILLRPASGQHISLEPRID
ncbi:Cytochrome CYP340K4 [Operophtera brumata]|uniref:Cytochrome CYP340K4 n=1 Tax=Operophtera brumata TaxID=104452 RepID=A0A0L7LNP1_OPEBR|nr:Cytochrome CYP340K4 [Operophtera brumata]